LTLEGPPRTMRGRPGPCEAFLCCDLAALSPAAMARLYVSSVLPMKISNRRRQSETPIRTAL
jgi:hypothetical protein